MEQNFIKAYNRATPRWRFRRRRQLEHQLDVVCSIADLELAKLGSPPNARPLREIIRDEMEHHR